MARVVESIRREVLGWPGVEEKPHRFGGRVSGRAEVFGAGGQEVDSDFGSDLIRITLTRIVAWGLDTGMYEPNSRSVGVPEGSGEA